MIKKTEKILLLLIGITLCFALHAQGNSDDWYSKKRYEIKIALVQKYNSLPNKITVVVVPNAKYNNPLYNDYSYGNDDNYPRYIVDASPESLALRLYPGYGTIESCKICNTQTNGMAVANGGSAVFAAGDANASTASSPAYEVVLVKNQNMINGIMSW